MTTNRGALGDLLNGWVTRGVLRPLDRAFGLFLRAQVPEASPLLVVSAAVTSYFAGLGHSCIELPSMMSDYAQDLRESAISQPNGTIPASAQEWYHTLNHTTVVDPEGTAPLALTMTDRADNSGPVVRLYLKRYYRYEHTIRDALQTRLLPDNPHDDPASHVDAGRLSRELDSISPATDTPDWQRIACALTLRTRFSVITGGPGTGKTTTVVRILALLQSVYAGSGSEAGSPLTIRLAAPTGKAAARLQESIVSQLEMLPEGIRGMIPREVVTLHRLLRLGGGNRTGAYGRSRRLPADVVVVDEASMMDVEMTARLFQALPDYCRLILLGDKDQLASVEAGAVMADLCARVERGHYTPETARWVAEVTGSHIPADLIDPAGTFLDQGLTMLRRSHRFAPDSEIGRLAQAVRNGDASRVADLAAPRMGMNEGAIHRPSVTTPASAAFRDLLHPYRTHIRTVVNAPRSAAESGMPPSGTRDIPDINETQVRGFLERFGDFRVLCALRDGPWGVVRINELVEKMLREEGLIPADAYWYAGRPVLVTRNDYRLGLMNGDVGIALPFPEGLRVAFDRGADRGVHWVLPSRLHAVETVYAMTVHKSQGSEFDHVVLVLPDRVSPVLTRELLYTGITRTRQEFSLVCAEPSVLEKVVRNRVERTGGLGDILHAKTTRTTSPSGEV